MAIRDLKNQNADLIAEKIHIHGNVSQNEEYKEIKQRITEFIDLLISESAKVKTKNEYDWIKNSFLTWKLFLKNSFSKDINQKLPFRKFKEGRCENCQTPIHKEKIRHCEACLRKMFKFQEELLEYLGLTSEEIIFFRSFKKKQNFIFSFEDGKLVK